MIFAGHKPMSWSAGGCPFSGSLGFPRRRVIPESGSARAPRRASPCPGIAPQPVDRIAKAFPHLRALDIPGALVELPELRQLAADAGGFGPWWELAAGLDALPRGYVMHPCGVILSDATLLDRLPAQPTPGDYPMVQADKDDVEELGLLKLDVLGVRMHSAMAPAITKIRRTTGRQLDLDSPDHLDVADPDTFDLIRRHVPGCFQIESPGRQDFIGRLQPRHMQDVIADISLFRPGPVKGGMPAHFIAARHGITWIARFTLVRRQRPVEAYGRKAGVISRPSSTF